MEEITMNFLLAAALIISLIYFLKQIQNTKKKEGSAGGIKRYLTSICFFMIAFVILVAMTFDLLGIIVWGIVIIFTFLAAYFTKFFPTNEDYSQN